MSSSRGYCCKDIRAFSRPASLLQEKPGLILLQLPPRAPYNPEYLQRSILSFGHPDKIAIEFRDNKWLTQETKDMLLQLGTTSYSADAPETPLLASPIPQTMYSGSTQRYIRQERIFAQAPTGKGAWMHRIKIGEILAAFPSAQ
ncbi:MAG: DUF72 domain-containing protein [Pseudomonadota bacterium]